MALRPAVLVVLVLVGPACGSGSSPPQTVPDADAADTSTGVDLDGGVDAPAPQGDADAGAGADADASGTVDVLTARDGSDGLVSNDDGADTSADATRDATMPADATDMGAGFPATCTPASNDPSRAAQAVLDTPLPCSGTSYAQYVRFTTPASPAGGGYAVVRFTDVSTATTLDTFLYMGDMTGTPYSLFELKAGKEGDPLTYWFAAYPATSYVIRVVENYGGGLGRFTISASYTPVYSALRATLGASDSPRLTVGTPVDDYVFRGYRSFFTDTWGWSYKVTLAQGLATVALSNLSPDFYTTARMNDAFGSNWYSPFTPMGQDFTLTTGAPVQAGEYIIWVEAYKNPRAYGLGDTPSSFVTKPFKMIVRQ